jgi:hypothetical protein
MSSDANPTNQIMVRIQNYIMEENCNKNSYTKQQISRKEDRRKQYRINSGRRQIDLLTYY